MNIITSSAKLAAACERLARHPYITVDTEFMRETTYYPKLCLLQVASVEEALLIDPLAQDIDLEPFFSLLRDGRVIKVFHAARQDIEIFWHMARTIPQPLFDTQIAAMVCGYGDQVSYEQLANDLGNARIDKTQRFTDWSRRPLSEAQLNYAKADVTHLRAVYEALAGKLAASGRESWLAEDMAVLEAPGTYETKPEDAWQRLAGRLKKQRDLGVLIEVAAWRERDAQKRDVPRQRVLRDDALMEVVQARPQSVEALGRLRAVSQGLERSRAGQAIIAAVERGVAIDPKNLPPLARRTRLPRHDSTVEFLKLLLKIVSQKTGVASKIIATVDDLDALAVSATQVQPVLTGWRGEIFGDLARDAIAGRVALALERGEPRIITLDSGEETPSRRRQALVA
ncbi:MAG: ribonuclease D [Hyphomicrobiales bacterium]|nr:ribonuclease D [Hyphomicrobiales bacterium]MBV9432815.1 ribonuclease D [Hyphomicrobiales bacterium]MBV9739468.1 ribonuclease D [Hyphomicrobiales bacterium]